MKRITCVGVFLCFLASLQVRSGFCAAQQDSDAKPQSTAEERAKWPLPPDLVHFRSASCYLFRMVKQEALNAKTGKMEPILTVWVVQPTAQYDDQRAEWRYEHKDGVRDVIGERVSGHDAWDLCQEWMGFTKAAAAREREKNGHQAR